METINTENGNFSLNSEMVINANEKFSRFNNKLKQNESRK
jgi:hypothetical protein